MDRTIIGKTVRITKGPLKGYFGTVKDATNVSARVELHAEPKTINVDRQRVAVVNADGSAKIDAMMSTYSGGSRTPSMAAGKTPQYGFGSQTPIYGAGSQTPMHDAVGGRTPHYGSATPAYEGGGRTPSHQGAWDPANVTATPAHSSFHEDNDDDGNYSAARTPAYAGSEGKQLFINCYCCSNRNIFCRFCGNPIFDKFFQPDCTCCI